MKQTISLSLLTCIISLSSLSLHAAIPPTGPGGSTLFKKSCDFITPGFYECYFCEDKELKTNCKKYYCTGEGSDCSAVPSGNPTNPNDPKNLINRLKVSGGLMLIEKDNSKQREIIATYKPGAYVCVSFSTTPADNSLTKVTTGDYGDIVATINKCLQTYATTKGYNLQTGLKTALAKISSKTFKILLY